MRSLPRSIAALALLAAVAGRPPDAAAAGAPQQPVFRASTDLVVVDVTVLDRDAAPVKDLRAGDFRVTVDGQPRRVASVQFIDESIGPAAAATAVPLVSSNETGGGGRLVLIVVDESTIRFGGVRAAMESIDRLLAGLGRSDRIALAALPGPRMLVDFGTDRQRIVATAKRILGGAGQEESAFSMRVAVSEAFAIDRGAPQVLQAVAARECRTLVEEVRTDCQQRVEMVARQVVAQARSQVRDFIGGLGSLLGAARRLDAPKIVILFSEGLASPEAPVEIVPLAYEAAAARAVIYTMRLDSRAVDASERVPANVFFEDRNFGRDSLETLAAGSRGTMFEITGGGDVPFDRLARELSGYYLLGLEPEGSDRDGRPHRIQVTTGRSGLTVRARPAFTFEPARAAAMDDSQLLAATLRSPVIATGVPLRVTTVNMADEDARKVRVMVLAEIGRDREQGGEAQMRYAIYDPGGTVVAGSLRGNDLQKTASGTLAFVGISAVPAGSYTVKIAAVREGRAGSVEHPFTARLVPAPPFQLGDLLVRAAVRRGEAFAPAVASTVSGDAIMGFVQLRVDHDVPNEATFSFEIAKEEAAAALVSAPAVLPASRTPVRTMQAIVDARVLPPGDYTARLAVSLSGRSIGSLTTRFSLERGAGAGHRAGDSSGTRDVAPFRLAEVLAPAALVPFLDELAAGAEPAMRAALDKAREGRFDEAAQQLKAGSANDPRRPFIRGLALLGRGEIQAASDAFREAMRADPEFLVGAFFIGTCYAAGGRPREAINAWQTSLVSLDRFPLVYRLLVDALVRNGEPERAVNLLDEALSRWPDDDTLRSRMVRAAFEAGRFERAWQSADAMAGRGQVDPDALFLAMQGVLQAAIDGNAEPALLARLERYRDLYAAAGGDRQLLVAEWVSFVRARVKP